MGIAPQNERRHTRRAVKTLQIHPWNVTVWEARAIQVRMASKVSKSNAIPENARYVVGTDISPPDASGIARGAAVVMSLPELQIVEVKCVVDRPGFPYIPGLLSFRESPLVLGALEKLTTRPDFLLVDGQGIAHPRRFGLACHIGLLADIPAIGCAKSILVGKHGHLDNEQGSLALIEHKGDVVGTAIRTRTGVCPIFVSIGHKVDLPSARRWVLACCGRYRMPESTRLAHMAAAGRIPEQGPHVATNSS